MRWRAGIAGLFASYAPQRPQLLVDWSAGTPTDGAGDALDPDLDWQPQTVAGTNRPGRCRAAAHPARARPLQRLQESATELPRAAVAIRAHPVAATDIELLDALAVHHDLHLWLPHPSDALWRALAGVHGQIPRREDASHQHVGHPLLATLGRDLRELQARLPAEPCRPTNTSAA